MQEPGPRDHHTEPDTVKEESDSDVISVGGSDHVMEDSDVTPAHLEDGDVTAAHLEDGDVTAAHLEDSDVTPAHLEDSDVTPAHMEDSDVTAAHLEDSDVTPAHLDLQGFLTEKKVYRCAECRYVTDRKNNLKRHVVTMHERCTKTLECCDTLFSNKAALREHVLRCHRNGYECRVCGRNFCRKALLKRHVTVHSGQKDYLCGVCGYATSHKSNLDRHKRRHGPRPDPRGEQRALDHRSITDQVKRSLAGNQVTGSLTDDSGMSLTDRLTRISEQVNRSLSSQVGRSITDQVYAAARASAFSAASVIKSERERPDGLWLTDPARFHDYGALLGSPFSPLLLYGDLFTPRYLQAAPRKPGAGKLNLLRERLLCTHGNQAEADRQPSPGRAEGGSPPGRGEGHAEDARGPPGSSRRMFPVMHRCSACSAVFSSQVALAAHCADCGAGRGDVTLPVRPAPQRPLTLLTRDRFGLSSAGLQLSIP